MRYELYIDRTISLYYFEIAWHTIVARLEITDIVNGIWYDYNSHKFCIRIPDTLETVEKELEDVYVITKIEKVD